MAYGESNGLSRDLKGWKVKLKTPNR